MSRRIFFYSLLALSLCACSNVGTRKQAKGSFDYVDLQPQKPFNVPSDLTKPAEQELYKIPEVTGEAGPIGDKVDVRAPALVLPLASGSRLDEFDKTAAIWYDKIDDDRDLREQVIKAITDYLATENVGFVNANPEQNTWESDWFHIEQESGYLFWKSIDMTESWRFKYSFVTKPHGRSIGLNVELVDYMFTDEKGSTKKIDPIEQQRVEMGMINAITAQLDYQYRVNNKADRDARASMVIVTVGESPSQQPAYIIEYPIDDLWEYIPGFFEEYNFEVTDLNRDRNFFEVNYTRVDSSLWDEIWGDAAPVVALDSGVYKFKLIKISDEQTALVITDDQGTLVTKEQLEENFDVMGEALSFR
ncbi:outer membrane protein assembly factor BamC [Thalassotalea crassostreae]|uniref:outer membrane protein assembly factor BamC n=1 Tax=Thalassotalea crassostreae TaxID=1763536 RepID=UPI0008A1F533|nr:outer membrane protein assembly factor BamC [Thalassotalea crassostreae]